MIKRRAYIFLVLAFIGLVVGGEAYYKRTFPYGESHCCILGMSQALEMYAEANGGRYPAGEASLEASLSLLYKSNYINAYTLRGFTVPEQEVRRILESGRLLGPESCGWHYVPGLTSADDTRLALLWCKQPLGHNGERTKAGSRQVVFVGGLVEWVSSSRWSSFVREQQELLKHRTAQAIAGMPLVIGSIELPDGTRVDHVDCPFTLQREWKGPNSSGSGTGSGNSFNQSELIWYQPFIQDGSVTRTLVYSNLISEPVTVTFSNGAPNVTNFVFKMRTKE